MLEEKRIPYQYIEVNPYHKPESLLKLNPRGLVPTLEYDGKPLYESTVVVDFLEEAYPDHGSVPLYPKDPYEKARQRIWIDYVTSRIIPAYHRFLQFQTEEGGKEGFEKVKSEFLGHLREWIKEADPEGPFFAGKEPGAIDFSFAPWVVSSFLLADPCVASWFSGKETDQRCHRSVPGSSMSSRVDRASRRKGRRGTMRFGRGGASLRRLSRAGRASRRLRASPNTTSHSISAMQITLRNQSWLRVFVLVGVWYEGLICKGSKFHQKFSTSIKRLDEAWEHDAVS